MTMREDDQVWWTIGSWKASGRIDMVRADTIVDACLALRAKPCRVHECSTPYLLKLAATPERGAVGAAGGIHAVGLRPVQAAGLQRVGLSGDGGRGMGRGLACPLLHLSM
jgi:hypothetical protein